MEGFKSNTKMQCFREGGQVKYESRKEHKEEMAADIAQDKKIVKKAFKMHDEQEHKGERTDLSKLKKGGRSKKATGTVKKYKTGGTVENAYGAKKTDKDIKDIANAKRQKPQLLCGGKSVKKMADGRLVGPMGTVSDLDNLRMMERAKRARKYLGPAQQSEFVNQGGMNPAPAPSTTPAPSLAPTTSPLDQMGNPTGMPAQKRGGKVKKGCK